MKSKLIPMLVLFVMLLTGLISQVHAITASEYSIIINLSGKQRMLTQKISKEMLLVAYGIESDKNQKKVMKTASLFEKTLEGLIEGSEELGLPPTKNVIILEQLEEVDKLWVKFRTIFYVVALGGKVQINKVAKLNLPLLKKMNAAVKLYEIDAKKMTGKNAGVVINLAGKQRMLTQKMSKEMLLTALGYMPDKNQARLRETASLFDRTLNGLRDGDTELNLPPTKNTAIVTQLDKVASLWAEFKTIIDRVTGINSAKISRKDVQEMAKLNLPLLREMDKAVKMYELASQIE